MKKSNRFTRIILSGLIIGALSMDISGMNILAKKSAAPTLANPVIDEEGITTWDAVYFGEYWQNDTNGNGYANKKDSKDPIKWRVLSVEGNDAYLMADRVLEGRSYVDVEGATSQESMSVKYSLVSTWKDSSVRKWLNETFIDNAFSKGEASAIITKEIISEMYLEDDKSGGVSNGKQDTSLDKITLLTGNEVINKEYGFCEDGESHDGTRVALCTPYADSKTSGLGGYGCETNWITRTPAYGNDGIHYVDDGGYINDDKDDEDYIWEELNTGMSGIRPVLHLDISKSNVWKYAGKVKSDDFKNVEISKAKNIKIKKMGKNKLKVTCKKLDRAVTYELQYYTSGNKKKVKKIDCYEPIFTLKNMKKGSTYYIKIRATNSGTGDCMVKGKWSNIVKYRYR